jgi:hypothetical protein
MHGLLFQRSASVSRERCVSAEKAQWKPKMSVEALSERRQSPIQIPLMLHSIAMIAVRTP